MNGLSRLSTIAIAATVTVLGVGSWSPPSTASTQTPETFSNLQVLPADISRRELVDVMRGYAGSMGARCDYCHVGDNPDTLEGFDFAADDKETKLVARAMMRMVATINDELLPATGRESAALIEVGCFTCHRGISRPESLRSILMSAYEVGGVDAVVARYTELREKYYGRAAYDFGRASLSSLAERIGRAHGDLESEERLLLYNIDMYPDWDNHYFVLGQTRRIVGNVDGAREALQRAIELAPDNVRYREALDRLTEQ